MIRLILAWLGITPTGYVVQPDTHDGHTVWDWHCRECRSGVGNAPTYNLAIQAADLHLIAAHGAREVRS